MSENDDLIKKYGRGGTADFDVVQSPNADLINKYGRGVVAAQPEIPAVVPSDTTPRPGRFETNVGTSAPNPFIQDVKNAPGHYWETFGKKLKENREFATEGAKEAQSGALFTGMPKALLGGAGWLLSPATAGIEVLDEFAQKATGNPKFKPVELLTTTGLPIAKTGSVAANAMPSTRAIRTLIDTIGTENIPKIISELKSNPRLTLQDVDPNAQIISMGLAARPGKPRDVLHSFGEMRRATEKQTVETAYNDLMGKPVNIKAKIDELKTNIKDVGKEINPIIAQSKPVDVSYVIAHIDDKLKPGITSVITAGEPLALGGIEKELQGFRKYITNDKSNRTDAESLHRLQSGLRSRAEDLMNSTDGQNRQIGYALMQVRNKLVDAIDAASPRIANADGTTSGSYRAALAKYRDENDIADAFKKGQLITRNKLGQLEDRPEYWDEWIKKATPQELEAAREGARDAVAAQMGSFRFAAKKGEAIAEVEYTADKLRSLFGEKETNRMLKVLSDERKIADTNTKEFQNSMTAMRLLAAEKTKVRDTPKHSDNILPLALEGAVIYGSGGSMLGAGALLGYGAQGARKGLNKIGQKLDEKTNIEIAKLASAAGESKDALIKALENHYLNQNKLTMKQKLKLLPIAP